MRELLIKLATIGKTNAIVVVNSMLGVQGSKEGILTLYTILTKKVEMMVGRKMVKACQKIASNIDEKEFEDGDFTYLILMIKQMLEMESK